MGVTRAKRLYQHSTPMNLHIGSGPIHLPGFVNLDKEAFHNPDVVMDALDIRMKYGENSIENILSIHMLEHLRFPTEANCFLKAAHDVLKPGGLLRLVVPNLELVAKAYASGSDLKFIYGADFKGYYHYPESRAEKFHFFMTSWQHQMVYDFELLKMMLIDAGFRNISPMPFGVSKVQALCNHDRFLSESIAVESSK